MDRIKQGIMMGPMKEEEIPFKEEGVKINGVMVNLKVNGVARVILNMSRGRPFCVNEGMSNEERFEVPVGGCVRCIRLGWVATLPSWIGLRPISSSGLSTHMCGSSSSSGVGSGLQSCVWSLVGPAVWDSLTDWLKCSCWCLQF